MIERVRAILDSFFRKASEPTQVEYDDILKGINIVDTATAQIMALIEGMVDEQVIKDALLSKKIKKYATGDKCLIVKGGTKHDIEIGLTDFSAEYFAKAIKQRLYNPQP